MHSPNTSVDPTERMWDLILHLIRTALPREVGIGRM